MRPQLFPVGLLSKFSNSYAVVICRNVLGNDVHRDLAEEHVWADACRRGNARGVQDVFYQHPRKIVRIDVIEI